MTFASRSDRPAASTTPTGGGLRRGSAEGAADSIPEPRWRLSAIGRQEMTELVLDAWRMVVPKRLAAAHLAAGGTPDGPARP